VSIFVFSHVCSPLGLHLSKWIFRWVTPKRALRGAAHKRRANIVRRGAGQLRPRSYHSSARFFCLTPLFFACGSGDCDGARNGSRGAKLPVVPDSKLLGTITAPPYRLQPRPHHLGTTWRLVRPAAKGRRRQFGALPEGPDAFSRPIRPARPIMTNKALILPCVRRI